MSIEVMNWVWNHSKTKGSKRLVLVSLADNANDNGEAWPSINRIAKKCRLSRRYTIDILNKLEDEGHIKRTQRRKDDGEFTSTKYRIIMSSDAGRTIPSEEDDTTPSDAERTEVVNQTSLKPSVNPKLKPYDLAVVLADVCKMDLNANKGRLLREAKLLNEATPTPTVELVSSKYGGVDSWWYRTDWRGQKGEPPTPHFVRETWGRWSDNGNDELITEGKGIYL